MKINQSAVIDKTLSTAQVQLVGGPNYAPLTEQTIRQFLLDFSNFADFLGGAPETWEVREVGDGNLNLVFVITGSAQALVVKQALPYVRLVGESWPLPLDRAFFEQEALGIQANLAPGRVPRVYAFDSERAAIVMEFLTPHIIFRKGLVNGIIYPYLAEHMAKFTASTLYGTSDFACPAAIKRGRQALFSRNAELCKITEELVFTDPYRVAELNRWTSPQLDAIAEEFRVDGLLKVSVQELKLAFLSRSEALLHGDLHTGSIMVTEQDTKVIDPEFAFVGPIGFDLGAFMANLLLAYFSQPGHAGPDDDRRAYQEWILQTLEGFWNGFAAHFLVLWRQGGSGDAFSKGLFLDEDSSTALDAFRKTFLASVLVDAIGFAGIKIIRRILGLAHVEDFEKIADANIRARYETQALRIARIMILERTSFKSVSELTTLARNFGDPSTI